MEQRHQTERRLAAILSADAQGYSRMMAEDEVATVESIRAAREIIRTHVTQHFGRVVDSPGDNLLAEFPSVVEAVKCAIEIQREFARSNSQVVGPRRMEFRIGIHVGDVMFEEGRLYGDAVNIAARLESLSAPGGVCISREAHDQIRGKLDVDCEDIGDQVVKNIPRPVRVLRVWIQPEHGPRAVKLSAGVSKTVVAAGVMLVISALTVVAWRVLRQPRFGIAPAAQSIAARRIRSLAVLPLENLSGDPSQEYFADGMTEELITNLAKISALRVISRTSVMRFKGGAQQSLPAIGKALNVDAIVEGSVFRAGDSVRITVQLIDAHTDAHLWAETYERDSHNVVALQDELSSAIAREINVELTPQERSQFVDDRVVNPDAYEAYLKGRYYLAKWTQEGRKRGKEYFEQAIKLDPSFALGYSGLADYYWQAAEWDLPQLVAMPKAREFALKALRLDNSLAEAFTALGSVDCFFDYDPVASERDLLRAISVNPGYAEAHHVYGWSLTTQARFEEAQAQMEAAQQLDPLSSQLTADVAMPIGWGGRPVQALEWCRRALELDPSFFGGHYCLAMNYDLMDNHALALAEAQRGEALEPAPLIIGVLGYEYARSERRRDAQICIKRLSSQSSVYVSPYYSATVYVGLGDTQKALDLLEKAYQQRSGTLVFLGIDRRFDSLRSDPRFRELVKKMGGISKRTAEGMAREVVPNQH